MAIQPTVFVPALAVAHLFGAILLLYSLEKVFGLVSKARRRLRSRVHRDDQIDLEEPDPAGRDCKPTADDFNVVVSRQLSSKCSSTTFQGGIALEQSQPVGRLKLNDAWIRGCSCCQGGCKHRHRWRPRDAAGKDVEDLTSLLPISVLPVSHPVDLVWSSLACKVLDKESRLTRQILYPTSGQVVPGEMMALVGPSGAGKSTLLDILAGRKAAKFSGQVWANGAPAGTRLKQVSAFVAQEEMYVPTLSCWETLRFHAVLRNRERASRGALEERMQDVLSEMGLWGVHGTQVGGVLAGGLLVRGLSGGEKRRLGIACALIGKPSLLFLDEPTTGLDSFAALTIMNHLSGLAASGHTVIASVHQPRAAVWDMFHKVLILSEGHQLYFGPPEQVTDWFSGCLGYSFWPGQHGSVADWLMDLVSVRFSKPAMLGGTTMASRADVVTASELWHAHHQKVKAAEEVGFMLENSTAGVGMPVKEQSAPRESSLAVGWWTQFAWLLKRSLVAQLRNPTDVTSRLLLSAWIGLLAGLVFYNLNNSPTAAFERFSALYFTMLLYELLPFCYMSFYVWDRKFLLNDRASGLYATSAYYAAHMAASLPFVIINTLCGALAAYGFAGLRYTPAAIALFGIILVLQSLIAIQVLVFCVYVSSDQDIAYMLATGYVGLSILLSGVFVRPSQLKIAPLLWLSYISYPRWAFQGLAWNEMSGIIYPPGANCIVPSMPGASTTQIGQATSDPQLAQQAVSEGFSCVPTSTGNQILSFWELSLTASESIAILAGVYIFFHVISYAALTLLHRQKR